MSQARCPVCGTLVDAAPRRCERCDTPHHPDCWEYLGGCGIFGCACAPLAAGAEGVRSALPSLPPDFVPLATEFAGFIRRQSEGFELIARGLVTAFLASPLMLLVAMGGSLAFGGAPAPDAPPVFYGCILFGLALALVFLTLAVIGHPGSPSVFDTIMGGRDGLLLTLLAVVPALAFAAYWAAGRALVDLQVTLNRIEAAGKGQGKGNR